jgi:hypothetical protein
MLASKTIRDNCDGCQVGVSFTSPGLASAKNGPEWLSALGSACDTFDLIDLHYYVPRLLSPTALDAWKAACPGKTYVSTETGIPDTPIVWKEVSPEVGGSREAQARDLSKVLSSMFVAGYSAVYWYLIDHDFVPGTDDPFEHIGLVTRTYEKKPSFEAYKTMIKRVDRFTTVQQLAAGQFIYSFADKTPVYLLWRDGADVPIPASLGQVIRVTDHLGVERGDQASKLALTESPVFVQSN